MRKHRALLFDEGYGAAGTLVERDTESRYWLRYRNGMLHPHVTAPFKGDIEFWAAKWWPNMEVRLPNATKTKIH